MLCVTRFESLVPFSSVPVCLFIQARLGVWRFSDPNGPSRQARKGLGWELEGAAFIDCCPTWLGMGACHPKKQGPSVFPPFRPILQRFIQFSVFLIGFSSSSSTAELYLEMGRLQETRNCIDDATLISKLNHQVLYMVSCLSVEQMERAIRILARVFFASSSAERTTA